MPQNQPTPNLWQSLQRLPSAPGLYRVLLPSGQMIPATWDGRRWFERRQTIEPVAWQEIAERKGPARSGAPKTSPSGH